MAAVHEHTPPTKPTCLVDALEPWTHLRQRLLAAVERSLAPGETSSLGEVEAAARAACAATVEAFWDRRMAGDRLFFDPWTKPTRTPRAPLTVHRLAQEAARLLDGLSLHEAAFLVGTLYTALLPRELRQVRGAYYTPPALAERLLDLAGEAGADWPSLSALDPACGGGAFLTPLAGRLLARSSRRSPEERLSVLEQRLEGIEIDGFAAWMTRTFLQILTHPLCLAAGRRLALTIRCEDALKTAPHDPKRFDLVVGNPPYGRVRLGEADRQEYRRSLFGHANLYGLFLDAALRWRSPGGLIAFVTPTSLLGGQYFSRLRNLLLVEAPPVVVDVLDARSGVFDLAQQETCLAVFGPNPRRRTVVRVLSLSSRGLVATRAGEFSLEQSRNKPWFLPRTPRQAVLAEQAIKMRTRLHHLGYRASTGPLVWNRHKNCLRSKPGSGTYPLIWAEAVRPNLFNFNYRSRAHASFFSAGEDQRHLLDSGPCVMVQRTTSKEQQRRLVACAVPTSFFQEWSHVVVENHVNVLRATTPGAVSPLVLAAVLNTETVDQVFRCLSGTVAVSASELHALPLPPPSTFTKVEALLGSEPGERPSLDLASRIEDLVATSYGVGGV